jgi:hypothetical protein
MGSNARARRSLAFAIHVSFKSPPRARLEATHDGGGSQPEERHGLAAEVLRIIRRRKNPVRGVLENCDLLRSGDSIPLFYQPFPESVPSYREQGASGNVPRIIVTAHCS